MRVWQKVAGPLLVLAASCSDGGGSGPPTVPQGAGGGSGAGGSGGAAGSSGAAGTGASGGSSTGGSGGSGGSSCVGTFQVTGALAGSAVQGELGRTPAVERIGGPDWSTLIVFKAGGALVIQGTGAASDGDTVVGKAYFGAPAKSFLNGKHFVVGQASLTYGDLTKPVKLSGLSLVGACPGSALAGSLTLCVNSVDCPKNFVIKGSLDTYAVNEVHDAAGHLYILGTAFLRSEDGGFAAHDGVMGGTGTGFLRWPATGAKADTVLCYESGTFPPDPGAGVKLAIGSLTQIGKVGDAKATAGELTLVEKKCP